MSKSVMNRLTLADQMRVWNFSKSMAELESEDSLDGTLVIDEPNSDCNIIEILDDSDSNSDVEVVEIDDEVVKINDEIIEIDDEVVEIDDDIEDTSLSLNSSSSLIGGSTCKLCYRKFPTNNGLLNHKRKYSGRLDECLSLANVLKNYKKKNTESLAFASLTKNKQSRPPKMCNVLYPPVPNAIPVSPKTIPVHYKPNTPVNDNLPSLRQMLIDEIEPEYPCPTCGQIFRHNIGLICHLNSEHKDVSTNQGNDVGGKSNKLGKRKHNKKIAVKDKKQIENNEPVSSTVDLTLLPELKNGSLTNRIKSYVFTDKNQTICILCNMNFQNTKKAVAHVEDKHIMDKLECGYCRMKFVYELKLRSHMSKRHKVICVYKCDKCSKMINTEESETHSEKCKGKKKQVQIKREGDTNFMI